MFAYRMKPFFRHGADTPWGGDGLRRYFGKEIPDNRTGESLEASTFSDPQSNTGESRAEDGRTLTEVAGRALPLILKLIDARQTLSVQVHPGDAYAMRHESGKRGKTEAWLILHAAPGAKIVYGFSEGVDIGSVTTENIESSLRFVSVKAGDVFYIPAGMVHAIGAGIVLYEIQQASDVTYRFWDWRRLSADGKPRALHFEKAREVARHFPAIGPVEGRVESRRGGAVTEYINNEYFALKRLHVDSKMEIPESAGFAFVTALCEGRLTRGGAEVPFRAGDTLFLPDCQQGGEILARGDLLLSGEGVRREASGAARRETSGALPPNPRLRDIIP